MTIETANRLYEYRKKNNLSQEELAEKMGVSRQAVSKWERAEASPDTDNLIMLSKIYGVTLDELINGEKENDIPNQECCEDEFFNDEDDVASNDNKDEKTVVGSRKRLFWLEFPWVILCTIAYLVFGFYGICGGWGQSWIIFITIPIYYSLIEAIFKRNPSEFAYPVLATFVYLYFGMYQGLWHPTWIIFVTIPVYYIIADVFKPEKDK